MCHYMAGDKTRGLHAYTLSVLSKAHVFFSNIQNITNKSVLSASPVLYSNLLRAHRHSWRSQPPAKCRWHNPPPQTPAMQCTKWRLVEGGEEKNNAVSESAAMSYHTH
ncbi:hypothetical protein XENOCAPTIV_005282 [Xenoophorus captivus]|uniref:Uncharacterized protein n=1 Tax=Xenoophorus captivus TaxID=1517983 RepID=A0ABV0QHR3_9TELE